MRCDVINNNVIDQCEQSTVLDNKVRIEFPSTVTKMDSFVSPSLNVALYKENLSRGHGEDRES